MTTETEAFDVLSFLEDRLYPETSVTIYTDKASLKKVADGDDSPEVREALEKSKITIELRGLSAEKIRSLTTKWSNKDSDKTPKLPEGITSADEAVQNELTAASIVAVRHGDAADTLWSARKVQKFQNSLTMGEIAKIAAGVSEVNFESSKLDNEVDAGFLGRGAE